MNRDGQFFKSITLSPFSTILVGGKFVPVFGDLQRNKFCAIKAKEKLPTINRLASIFTSNSGSDSNNIRSSNTTPTRDSSSPFLSGGLPSPFEYRLISGIETETEFLLHTPSSLGSDRLLSSSESSGIPKNGDSLITFDITDESGDLNLSSKSERVPLFRSKRSKTETNVKKPITCTDENCTDENCKTNSSETFFSTDENPSISRKQTQVGADSQCRDPKCNDANCTGDSSETVFSKDESPSYLGVKATEPSKTIKQFLINIIGLREADLKEGCSCCVNIDVDEALGAGKLSNKGQDTEANGQVSNLDSGSQPVSPDISPIAITIAPIVLLIAGPIVNRNVNGSIATFKQINERLETVKSAINHINDAIDKGSCKIEGNDTTLSDNDKEFLNHLKKRLEAFQTTLNYSKKDSIFNRIVPGYLTGVAAGSIAMAAVPACAAVATSVSLGSMVAISGFWMARHAVDCFRSIQSIRVVTQSSSNASENVPDSKIDGKRIFTNFNFKKAVFHGSMVGGFGAIGIGALGLLAPATFGISGVVAIGLLAGGTLGVTYFNNKLARNFLIPNNGSLGGIGRLYLDEPTTYELLVKLEDQRNFLKTKFDTIKSQINKSNLNIVKSVTSSISSALCSVQTCFPRGLKPGLDKLHNKKVEFFNQYKGSFTEALPDILNEMNLKLGVNSGSNESESVQIIDDKHRLKKLCEELKIIDTIERHFSAIGDQGEIIKNRPIKSWENSIKDLQKKYSMYARKCLNFISNRVSKSEAQSENLENSHENNSVQNVKLFDDIFTHHHAQLKQCLAWVLFFELPATLKSQKIGIIDYLRALISQK